MPLWRIIILGTIPPTLLRKVERLLLRRRTQTANLMYLKLGEKKLAEIAGILEQNIGYVLPLSLLCS